MPRSIPFPTKPKKAPEETTEVPNVPEGTELESAEITASAQVETVPEQSQLKDETPDASPEVETVPDPSALNKEMPSILNKENVIVIGGEPIEIKPTKLKYFRNKTTASYGYIKAIPLTEFLSYDKGVLDPDKDADQLLFDFLVAVFDSSEFVRDHYDEMSADDVEQAIKIFGRINHIDDKEEAARKNRQAQGNR